MIHLHVFQRCSPILLLFSVAAATPLIYWDVDSSADIDTPAAILRGDRGLPVTQYSTGFNGNATNIYGGRGRMPHFQGATPINGGIPQHGNLSEHIEYYERDLAALIPKEDFVGVCLIDYEFWRADWNSTPGVYRTKSIEATGGDEVLAKAEYEEGARLFMLATINATRKVRPGCQIGWYGYPTNHLPFIPSVSYTNWCSWPQNVGACFFEGYDTPSGEAQRMLNDEILWLFKALDVLTPSVYLGILPDQTTYDESRAYVNSTVLEAVRLAAASGGKSVVPVTWYMTNNYRRRLAVRSSCAEGVLESGGLADRVPAAFCRGSGCDPPVGRRQRSAQRFSSSRVCRYNSVSCIGRDGGPDSSSFAQRDDSPYACGP
ncbi:unnamed protein product [Prorocentrum cordatum]|uniref:Hyaluronoglucosaminidase n=1 Tax=Prorocentrum cordatum TaxID=2364126 RepID=A0ABN9Y4H5_9DINO|nr:unnamed protein product [Polarella glacialis]